MRHVFALLVILVVLVAPAAAQSDWTYGAGTHPCQTYLENSDSNGLPNTAVGFQFEAWYQGYVTAISLNPKTPTLRETNRAEMNSFIRGYCSQVPDVKFVEAAEALVKYLIKYRPSQSAQHVA